MKKVNKVVVEHYRIHDLVGSMLNSTGMPPEKYLLRYCRNEKDENSRFSPYPKGGATRVILVLDDGTEVKGFALCSMADNFSYKIGRNIALGRANRQLVV